MATVKLATNIPVVGTVKYCDLYPAKIVDGNEYGAQIGLKGTWDEHGDGAIYIPAFLVNDLIKAGLVQSDGEKQFQGQTVPQFKWLYRGRVQVLKAEEGRTKRTSVLPLDAMPAPGQSQLAPLATPKQVSHAVHQPTPVAATPASPDDPWAALTRQYDRAVQIASQVWGEDMATPGLVAAAATVFIEANKRGLIVPLTAQQQAEAIRDQFDAMPAALARDEPPPWLDQ